jgi:hypothetical protein
MVTSADLQALAGRLAGDCSLASRRAFWWDESRRIAVVFGNDDVPVELLTAEETHRPCPDDPDPRFAPGERGRFQVASIRRVLAESGGAELGFATVGSTAWILACSLPEGMPLFFLDLVVWFAWDVVTDSLAAGRGVPALPGRKEILRAVMRLSGGDG